MGKDEGTPNPHARDHVLEVGGHADTDLLCFLSLEGVYQLGLLHDIVDTVRYRNPRECFVYRDATATSLSGKF